MKPKLHKKIKIFLVALFLVNFFVLNALPASAQICIPCVFAYAESRYHLNLGSIQNMGEGLNVSSNKDIPPQVMVSFNPSDPKPGEKVTATATPMYFSNTKENLYYTWYIKHKKGSDSVEDWKREAARIIANGGWDPGDLNGDGEVNDDDFDIYYENVSDDDKDGFYAPMGGADREGMNSYCYVHDFTTGKNYEMLGGDGGVESYYDMQCPSGYEQACIMDSYGDIGGSNNDPRCVRAEVTPYCDNSGVPKCDFGIPRCIENNFENKDGTCSSQGYSAPNCSLVSSSSGNRCRHIFASGPDGTETGDGSFGKREEEFWKTNPQDSSTADNGNKDEANIVGLGQDTFSWTYQDGDKVGVAVEGVSITPTKHDDSSYMIMWALPNNKCDVENKGSYIKNIKGYNVTIPTTRMGINRCLEDNLVDPRNKGFEKIDMSLSYSPDNPINDSSGSESGDILTIKNIFNQQIENYNNLFYEWRIGASRDPNGSFSDISKKLTDDKLVGKLQGINLSSLSIALNLDSNDSRYSNYFSDDISYFRVRLTVRGSLGGEVKEGRGEVIVRVNSSEKRMSSYISRIDDSGERFTFGSEDLICKSRIQGSENNLDYYICPVLKNQVIGLEVNGEGLDNFYWTVNDQEINCDGSISNKCSGRGNTIFIPISGNLGNNIIVKMIANDIEQGKSIEISRIFQIVEPYIRIISEDNESFWPKMLGSYNDLNGNQHYDFSESNFFTYTGLRARLKAEFHPDYLERIMENNGMGNVLWTIDDQLAGNSKSISFNVQKNYGEVYNIRAEALYAMPIEFRRALMNKWQISQFNSESIALSHSIQGEIILDDQEDLLSIKNTGKILASLASNLPSQIIFLLRTVLTVFVVVLASGISLNLLLNPSRNKNK